MNRKQIVFVEPIPTIMLFKIAKALRNVGYETVLISLLEDFDKEFYSKAYNKIFSFHMKSLSLTTKNLLDLSKKIFKILKTIISIKKLKPYETIGRSEPNWLCALTNKLTKKSPFFYLPYDVLSLYYKDEKMYGKLGIPRFDMKAEKYCFERSDGIIHKGGPNEITCLRGKFNITSPIFHFFPYCLKDIYVPINRNKLSKENKSLNLVFIGSVHLKDIPRCISGEPFSEVITKIVNQKIHFHIYSPQYEIIKKSKEYIELLKNKYFHLHAACYGIELAKKISRCDFGFWVYYPTDVARKEFSEDSFGNKMSTFIEAGIPYICNNELKFIKKVGEEYGVGIGLSKKQMKNIKNHLKKTNYEHFIKNIEIAREKFEINSNIHKLEKFFEEVRNTKKLIKK